MLINMGAMFIVLFQIFFSALVMKMKPLRAMMTGGLISNKDKNDIISYYADATFLAEILIKKGYRTAGFTDHEGVGEPGTPDQPRVWSILRGFDSFRNIGKLTASLTPAIYSSLP